MEVSIGIPALADWTQTFTNGGDAMMHAVDMVDGWKYSYAHEARRGGYERAGKKLVTTISVAASRRKRRRPDVLIRLRKRSSVNPMFSITE
jgi:hypothetical protein